LISRLRTLLVSPKAPQLESSPLSEKPAVDWKKPAVAVTKLVSLLFLTILAASAGWKFLQNPDALTALENSASNALPKSFDPMKSVNDLMPKSFDPMKSISNAWPKSFDPMKSVNDAIPKSFDPLQSINKAIAGLIPQTPTKPATPIASQQVNTKHKAVQKQLKASGQSAEKFYKQVDQVFYQKHPELQNRQLRPGAADNGLRDEWWSIAQQILKSQ
jgi:hypothetical protein